MKHFFRNDQFEFETQLLLGAAYHRASDIGEVLATADTIKDGDYESWFQAWSLTAARVHHIAESCEQVGHYLSARDAWLRASTYYAASTTMLDGTKDPERLLPTWRLHRNAFDKFTRLLSPPCEPVRIPYEDTVLVGYLFKPRDAYGPRPLVILNNGSDGPISTMWVDGARAATERGYLALAFDGPGQGEALLEQGLPLRPDWEMVISPIVDWALLRPDVDPARIALMGFSQGGYWVPRALAFEPRIVCGVADPGVFDVSASWLQHLPRRLKRLLAQGNQEKFDRYMGMGMRFSPRSLRQTLAFRMRPYGVTSPYAAFAAAKQYTLAEVVKQIGCPMLITEPDNEQFWPGQSQELYQALTCPKTLVRFTDEECSGGHCEPMARGLRDQRVFDWMSDVFQQQRDYRQPTRAIDTKPERPADSSQLG